MRLLLVDDHALFRHSLAVLLTSGGYDVVGTAANGLDALEQARVLQPDLVLMDIEMPGCDGLTATRLIKAEYPKIKVVVLTVSSSDEHLFEAVKSGACGYLLKSENGERFLEMIGHVAHGGAALPPDLAARLLEEFAAPGPADGDACRGNAGRFDTPPNGNPRARGPGLNLC